MRCILVFGLLLLPVAAQVPRSDLDALAETFAANRQKDRENLVVASRRLKTRHESDALRLGSLKLRLAGEEKDRSRFLIEQTRLEGLLASYRDAQRRLLIARDRTYRPSSDEQELKLLARRPHLASPVRFAELGARAAMMREAPNDLVLTRPDLKVPSEPGRRSLDALPLGLMEKSIELNEQLESEEFQLAADDEQIQLAFALAQLCAEEPGFVEGWVHLARALDQVFDAELVPVTRKALECFFPVDQRPEEIARLILRLTTLEKSAKKD